MFGTFIAALVAAVTLAAAAFVHRQLPHFTATSARLLAARAVLLGIGLASGFVASQMYGEVLASPLAFLDGFGVVHLPAGAILYLKGMRGEGPS